MRFASSSGFEPASLLNHCQKKYESYFAHGTNVLLLCSRLIIRIMHTLHSDYLYCEYTNPDKSVSAYT